MVTAISPILAGYGSGQYNLLNTEPRIQTRKDKSGN
jgi:hypothetical protein